MPILGELLCPSCGDTIQGMEWNRPLDGTPATTGYDSCARKCVGCGFGFSNSQATTPTVIYRDPFWDVPEFIARESEDVLRRALNVVSRGKKEQRFASRNSEDHVTWTMFQYLVVTRKISALAAKLGIVTADAPEPTVLLWGVSITPCERARELEKRIQATLDALGERAYRRSEPDVILDFGMAGLVFIEVKLRSPNNSEDITEERTSRYIDRSGDEQSSRPFVNSDKAIQSGLYELIRNWRILCELANDRPAALVNLGVLPRPGEAEERLKRFEESLLATPQRRFLKISWRDFIDAIAHKPLWLSRYIDDRGILDQKGPAVAK